VTLKHDDTVGAPFELRDVVALPLRSVKGQWVAKFSGHKSLQFLFALNFAFFKIDDLGFYNLVFTTWNGFVIQVTQDVYDLANHLRVFI